jgi:hypothetical protein
MGKRAASKAESEPIVRRLCHDWRKVSNLDNEPAEKLSFSSFYYWLQSNHRYYTEFRSVRGPRGDIEDWFIEEFGLRWRD